MHTHTHTYSYNLLWLVVDGNKVLQSWDYARLKSIGGTATPHFIKHTYSTGTANTSGLQQLVEWFLSKLPNEHVLISLDSFFEKNKSPVHYYAAKLSVKVVSWVQAWLAENQELPDLEAWQGKRESPTIFKTRSTWWKIEHMWQNNEAQFCLTLDFLVKHLR